jgi:hypothetical protein
MKNWNIGVREFWSKKIYSIIPLFHYSKENDAQ